MSETRIGPLLAIGYALAVAVVGLIAGAATTILALGVAGAIGLGAGLVWRIVLLVMASQLAFIAVGLGYIRLRGLGHGFLRIRVPTLRDGLWFVAGYVLTFVAAGVGVGIVAVFGLEAASNQAGELAIENPELVLVFVPLSILLIGPGEELLFRGVVQGTLRETFGPVVSVGLASAIFASVHFVALTGGVGGRLVTIGVLFLPSLVFGAVYEKTGNLVVNALIHGAYNATLFTLVYVAFEVANGPPA